ncbi:MAG: NAD(P)H-hydrate dehydratase [Xanthomonadales bacterium]|nr:NAD(P)H-hydrate dehydratase [Xanthomonadales bacterium]
MSDKLYTAECTRALDRAAIEDHGIPGYTLMKRAGNAVVEAARAAFPASNAWLILCGAGNNGGDGYVVARLAHEFGVKTRVVALADPESLSGDARQAFEDWRASGGETLRWPQVIPDEVNLVIDAMLGTGLDRPVEGAYAEAVAAVNAAAEPCVAVDIPSGLNADTGAVMGCAIHADLTVTFIGKKRGLFTAEGPEFTGRLLFDRLEVPSAAYEQVPVSGHLLGADRLPHALGRRPRNSHKGQFGHVLVVGGDVGMSGAARLAGEGALRSGAGLVSVATHPDHAALLNLPRPELMVHGVSNAVELEHAAERATVLALGPGLGTGPWGEALWRRCLDDPRPLVVDADGLNLLAENPRQRDDWILTPHPAEASRLLGVSTSEVQADRFGAGEEIARRFRATVVLKGCGTVVVTPNGGADVCALGNPGMSTGGAGDVLTGVLAAMRGQGLAAAEAARVGTIAHALAGDAAAMRGERGLLALDIARQLQCVVNPHRGR